MPCSHPLVRMSKTYLESIWVQRANSQAPMRVVSHDPVCKACDVNTYGGLLVRSVFKITGTLDISVTSWIYSPPSSLSLKNFEYFSLLDNRVSGDSAMGTLESDRVR